jgi:hypothetical protein
MIEQGPVARPQSKWTTIRARVTRADGSIEDRGIVSFSHKNPLINAVLSPLARFNGWAWERYYRFRNWRKS